MPTPNPLTGFDFCSLNDLDTNKLIKADYQDYIKTIKLGKYDFIGDVEYSKNKLGEHAVSILVGDDGTWWNHILVYDKNDKRIKTVKYTSGGYRS